MSTTASRRQGSEGPNGRGRGSGYSRGSRGGPRGRGRGRSPSLSSTADNATSSAVSSPNDDKPSLLSRIEPRSSNTPPSPKTQTRMPPSPSSPLASSPSQGNSRNRRRKSSASSPLSVNVMASHGQPNRGSGLKTPLSASSKEPPTHMKLSASQSLPSVTETPAIVTPSPVRKDFPHTNIPEATKPQLLPPSPVPSPRPFTPMGRDWAAEDDDDDDGSLPSLDDWGFTNVKAASEAGDKPEKRDDGAAPTSGISKLSLSTDMKPVRGRKSGSAPPSAVDTSSGAGMPSFGGIIPPTPVASRPIDGRSTPSFDQQVPPVPPVPSSVGRVVGQANLNRSGRSLSRPSSPMPLDLTKDRSPSPGPRSGSLPRSSSPRPTSGGVALGVRSRPTSPAPGTPGFDGRSPSPGPTSGFDLSKARPHSASVTSLDPGNARSPSPAPGGLGPPRSRPSSPGYAGKALSGGVALGISRPTSPNPEGARSVSPGSATQSNLSASRPPPKSDTIATWRSPQRNNIALPPKPVENHGLPPKPITQDPPPGGPLAARLSDPPPHGAPHRGGRGGSHRGGGRGGYGRGNDGGPFSHFHPPSSPKHPFTPNTHHQRSRGPNSPTPSQAGEPRSPTHPRSNQTLSPSTPTEEATPFSNRNSRNRFSIPHGRSREPSEAESPTSATSTSSAGRSSRGHARTSSRPVLSSAAISRLTANLSRSPPKRAKPSADGVPVTGS
ncbi:hypothetical protein FRB99_005283 [Tulasnella sp. 403]|nr:hypothetical protein FRB99_005283 [Tulasnella sp. 403]